MSRKKVYFVDTNKVAAAVAESLREFAVPAGRVRPDFAGAIQIDHVMIPHKAHKVKGFRFTFCTVGKFELSVLVKQSDLSRDMLGEITRTRDEVRDIIRAANQRRGYNVSNGGIIHGV